MLMPIPDLLINIPQPPKQLYCMGANIEDLLKKPRLAVVGSRKVTNYGRQVTTDLVRELAGQGVVIISGLAFGVDALAHQAALDAGGLTIAVLPSPIDNIAPRTNQRLAERILANGGVLISEYPSGTPILKHQFVERNRLVCGLADAVLLTEAAKKSGSLHTAQFALEQGREVLAVPGNINSIMSEGTNNLIKTGATPVTSASDVLYALNLDVAALTRHKPLKGQNEAEQAIINLLQAGLSDGEGLQEASNLSVSIFNQTLTMLEITGGIRSTGANQWALC